MQAIHITDNMRKLMSPKDREALGKDGLTHEQLMEKSNLKSEKELHELIKKMLYRNGIKFFGYSRMDKPTGCTVGWPDFVIPLPNGKVLFWEVKNGLKTPTIDQVNCLKYLNDSGHRWALIQSYRQAYEILDREMESE